MKRFGLALALFLALGSTVRADFNDGVYALMSGQSEKALQTFIPLAETQDHPYAQHMLGMMYFKGQGVPQDYAEAAGWFQRAAEQGVSQAQYKLGELYEEGKGVTQDYEYAFAWYSVADALQHKKAAPRVQATEARLNEEELNAARRLAKQFISKYGEAPEAVVEGESSP